MPTTRRAAMVGCLVAVSALIGVAAAAVTSPTTVSACTTKAGAVRALGTSVRCRASERKVVWNIKGPQGRIGAQGQKGVTGADGAAGATGATGAAGPAWSNLSDLDGLTCTKGGGRLNIGSVHTAVDATSGVISIECLLPYFDPVEYIDFTTFMVDNHVSVRVGDTAQLFGFLLRPQVPLTSETGKTITLTSSDASVASVPASVTLYAGEEFVPVLVQGLTVGTATITATASNMTTTTLTVEVVP